MKFTKFVTVAMVPCALIAAPAFAQSSATKAEDYAKEKAVEEVKDKAADEAKDMAMDKAKEMKEDHTLVIKTSDGEMNIDSDGVKMKDEMATPKPVMEKTETMSAPATSEPSMVVIACPEGTTAQDDGTCMITGDYAE